MADGMAVPPNCPQVTRSTFDIHSHGMIWLMQYSLLIDFCISQVLFSIYGIWKVTIFDWIARKRNLKKYGEAGAPDGKPSIVSDWNKQLVCCWSQDAMYGGFACLHPVAWRPTLPHNPPMIPPLPTMLATIPDSTLPHATHRTAPQHHEQHSIPYSEAASIPSLFHMDCFVPNLAIHLLWVV